MSIKTEILDSFKLKLKGLNIAKKVIRGIMFLDKIKKNDYPIIVFNSFRSTYNDEYSTFDRRARNMYVELVFIHKTNLDKNYYKNLDNYENMIIQYIEDLYPTDIHARLIDVKFLSSEEVINEEDSFDGLMYLKFEFNFIYYE